ncbi:MAG: DUF2786 domain-containing protein [Dehalococcoidia bacterium]
MDKTTIAARIKALLSKTTENGCTEAEAMAAATKARDLMDKHNIELGAVGMEAEGVTQATTPEAPYKTLTIKSRIGVSVAAFCDVKVWRNKGTLVFFGLQSDADFATWLIDSLAGFIQRSAIEYMATIKPSDLNPAFKMPKWEAEKAFILGAVHRICKRLDALTEERKRSMDAGTGKSLVVVKGAIVARAFAQLNLRLGAASKGKTRAYAKGAYEAGQAAGDRASFGRPVNGGGGTKLIA